MKTLITLLGILVSATVYASIDCTAPDSVAQVAKQIELTFDGSTIQCDDNSHFTSKFTFECKGDKFYNIKDADDVTRRADGSEVYVITVLSEQNGRVVMTEEVYTDATTYQNGASALESSESNFIPMSDRSFAFYSQESPGDETFLVSTWFIPADNEKTRGYKLFTNKSVSCQAQ
jgi:hypothetical protein